MKLEELDIDTLRILCKKLIKLHQQKGGTRKSPLPRHLRKRRSKLPAARKILKAAQQKQLEAALIAAERKRKLKYTLDDFHNAIREQLIALLKEGNSFLGIKNVLRYDALKNLRIYVTSQLTTQDSPTEYIFFTSHQVSNTRVDFVILSENLYKTKKLIILGHKEESLSFWFIYTETERENPDNLQINLTFYNKGKNYFFAFTRTNYHSKKDGITLSNSFVVLDKYFPILMEENRIKPEFKITFYPKDGSTGITIKTTWTKLEDELQKKTQSIVYNSRNIVEYIKMINNNRDYYNIA